MSQIPNPIVMKFGGAALSSLEQLEFIAEYILERKTGPIVVIVSAMGEMTDALIQLAHTVNPNPPEREYDMLVSIGERVSMSLLAMAIAKKHPKVISFTGSQCGIITSTSHRDASIIDMRPQRLQEYLEKEYIIIVAGFQGMSLQKEITTLGRGGSDTTAVALGAALGAEKVEFYKDVPGVFEKDPKKYKDALHIPHMTYKKMLEFAKEGAEVLHMRAVTLAAKNALPLHVLSFKEPYSIQAGTHISEQGTIRPLQPVFETE